MSKLGSNYRPISCFTAGFFWNLKGHHLGRSIKPVSFEELVQSRKRCPLIRVDLLLYPTLTSIIYTDAVYGRAWLQIFLTPWYSNCPGTLSQKQGRFPSYHSECMWEQAPWRGNFRKWFKPLPFENFRMPFYLPPLENFTENQRGTNCVQPRLKLQTLWFLVKYTSHYTIARSA